MIDSIMDEPEAMASSQQQVPITASPVAPHQSPPTASTTSPTADGAQVLRSPSHKRSLPPPAGPRSQRRGSSHTRFNPPVVSPTADHFSSSLHEFPIGESSAAGAGAAAPPRYDYPSTDITVVAVATPQSDMEVLPEHEYRSPEAVIEHIEEPSKSTLPPGVLAEHLEDMEGMGWSSSGYLPKRNTTPQDPSMLMDVDLPSFPDVPMGLDLNDLNVPDRPQIGPGVMAKCWFDQVHPNHKLWQPVIDELPKPAPVKTPPSRSVTLNMSPTEPTAPTELPPAAAAAAEAEAEEPPVKRLTLDDVWDALPGGREHHNEWYFCSECWAWYHVVVGQGAPAIPSKEEWEAVAKETVHDPEEFDKMCKERAAANHRLLDIDSSRSLASKDVHHFHSFPNIMNSTTELRLERVVVEGQKDQFAHLNPDVYGAPPPELTEFAKADTQDNKLWVSCASDAWAFVDKGPIPGQLPPGLVNQFTSEKLENPNVGATAVQSVIDAWSLVVTLLANALFKDKRGWVKMSNPTFQNKIGASLRSSHLLFQIGFGCRIEDEGFRVGPLTVGDTNGVVVTEENVRDMDKYMIRTWVEISLFLENYRSKNKIPQAFETVKGRTFGEIVDAQLHISRLPELMTPFPERYHYDLAKLGVMPRDTVGTIETAYDMQVSCDAQNVATYLGAIEKLAHAPVQASDLLQVKVATERSLDRYTDEDIQHAYSQLGITPEFLSQVMIDLEDFPQDEILKMHRQAVDKALDSTTRSNLSRALTIIGKERRDHLMIQLGKNGVVYLSLEQAYSEFHLSRDAGIDDELLILQYETWVQDRPSRADHYRMALSIIANAPGEERPVLQAFLSGKDISELQPPARRDIPAGLRNIGNTCYLNSVLQFLYAVKPVRDAVMTFEEMPVDPPAAGESRQEMEKRVKEQSSRRFVWLLGELFNDMYSTSNSAVVPKEELARLAILPIDAISERKDAIPAARIKATIDTLPIRLSPDTTPTSSVIATAAGSSRTTPNVSPLGSPKPLTSVKDLNQPSILGKRASQDRDSAFGGSEERLARRLTDDLIELDSETPTPVRSNTEVTDVDMGSSGMEPLVREDSAVPAALSQLGIESPLTEGSQPLLDPMTVHKLDQLEDGGKAADLEDGEIEEATLVDPPPPPPPAVSAPPPPLPPRRRSMALVAAEKFGLQQDAAEILINVLAQLECALQPVKDGAPNLISTLFSAKYQQQMLLESATGVEAKEPTEAVFTHPIIGVEEEGKDLYDCLAELYLGGAEIEYQNQKGYKMDLMDELPPMLYIQMRRSQYDPVGQRQTKLNTHIPFSRTLAMDRFLASADAAKRERSIQLTRDMIRMRARRHELKNHKPLAVPETFRFVRDFLGADTTLKAMDDELSVPDSLFDELDAEAATVEAEIAELDKGLPLAKAELEALWEGQQENEYELVSVFVHGGTGTGGHYWTYQADLPRDGDKFFYYSDETVKDVLSTDVFSDKAAQGVSPALLCYVRKDRELVDTLHRASAEPTPEPEAEADVGTGMTEMTEMTPLTDANIASTGGFTTEATTTGATTPAVAAAEGSAAPKDGGAEVSVLPASEAIDTAGW